MVGMNAMKARVRVAIVAILVEKTVSWKKTRRLMKPNTQSGMKIDTRFEPGNL